MYALFRSLFTTLKSSLDDDWANDLRFASIVLTKHLQGYLKDNFEHDDYQLIYTELLKRLDDAQDGIRIETCKVLEVFFEIIPDPWSGSLYEYTVKTIYVHLDDSNPEIQQAISNVLKVACTKQTDDFIRVSKEQVNKTVHPALCKSLMDHAMEVRSSR
mmetsp:Transcript_10035/g.16892  ORF Transcript_10035/g.16892 Transcript_10035/m.16892 type:complete len:159 (+) Transcript_10035:1130-1606(+)